MVWRPLITALPGGSYRLLLAGCRAFLNCAYSITGIPATLQSFRTHNRPQASIKGIKVVDRNGGGCTTSSRLLQKFPFSSSLCDGKLMNPGDLKCMSGGCGGERVATQHDHPFARE